MKKRSKRVQESGGPENLHSEAEDHHSRADETDNPQSRTDGGRNQGGVSSLTANGGAWRTRDPGSAEEMVRPDYTIGSGGQGGSTAEVEPGCRWTGAELVRPRTKGRQKAEPDRAEGVEGSPPVGVPEVRGSGRVMSDPGGARWSRKDNGPWGEKPRWS